MTRLFDNLEKGIAIALLVLMGIVVISATLEVAYGGDRGSRIELPLGCD